MTKQNNESLTMRIFRVLGVILLIVDIFSILFWIYFKTLGKEFVPTAVTSTYVTMVNDPMTGEELPFMEANLYEYRNDSNDQQHENGVAVLELKINSYSGTDKQAIYARGYQAILDNTLNISEIYCYDSYDGVSFLSAKQLEDDYVDDKTYITDIDGETYGVRLDGTYTEYEPSFLKSTWWVISGLFTGWRKDYMERTHVVYEVQYTMRDFMQYLVTMVISSSNGTGESVIPLADLGNYFSVYKEENAQFTTEVAFNTENNSYFTIATDYDRRGMTSYKQSLFKSVAGDSSFNLTGIPEDTDYWKDITTIELTEANFIKREVDDMTYITLNIERVLRLNDTEDITIEISINADKVNGIDYYGLCGLQKISKIYIYSSSSARFYLLDSSLDDTEVNTSDILTSNVTLIDMEVA